MIHFAVTLAAAALLAPPIEAGQWHTSRAGVPPSVTRLNVGEIVSGALTAADPLLPDSRHYDCFAVRTRTGQRLQIDQTSDAFDSYLSVGTGSCDGLVAVERDNDSGGSLNARILRDGDGSVLYIQASSFGAGETGAYRLRISPALVRSRGRAPAETGQPDRSRRPTTGHR